MPRVSREHTNARRQQILDAARVAFIRDGFHATSMQDIQRQAGLSAGAIYLYFKGKNEIIVAIAGDAMSMLSSAFAFPSPTEADLPDLDALIDRFLEFADRLQREEHVFPVIIQVWAEALRNPPLHAELVALFGGVMTRLTDLLSECQAAGLIDPDVDPASLRLALVGLVQGYIVQTALLGDLVSFERYRAGVHALLRAGAMPVDWSPTRSMAVKTCSSHPSPDRVSSPYRAFPDSPGGSDERDCDGVRG